MRAAGRHGKALPIFLGAVAVLLAAGAILWGASRLDERERPTEVADDGTGRPKDLFVVEVKEERRPTIVVECDEGVLADANARFRDFLGVKDPPISLPGGPMLLARVPGVGHIGDVADIEFAQLLKDTVRPILRIGAHAGAALVVVRAGMIQGLRRHSDILSN